MAMGSIGKMNADDLASRSQRDQFNLPKKNARRVAGRVRGSSPLFRAVAKNNFRTDLIPLSLTPALSRW